jgi:hypothetical protein
MEEIKYVKQVDYLKQSYPIYYNENQDYFLQYDQFNRHLEILANPCNELLKKIEN